MYFGRRGPVQTSNKSVLSNPFSFSQTFCRRLLILGYLSGLQIWDCTNLDSITELLNVSGPGWGRVLHAQVLPNPLASTDDQFLSSRPLLGVMYALVTSFCLFRTHQSLQCQTYAPGAGLTCVFPFNSQGCQEILHSRHRIVFSKFKLSNHRKLESFLSL
jgi:hypothetical protein